MEHGLYVQLGLATAAVVATVLAHLAGLTALVAMLRMHKARLMTKRLAFDQVILLVGAAFGLFALHTIEIWGYAALYLRLNAIPSFEEALYFSTVTYSTLGYGDLTLSRQWRILGAIEGINGLILLGWSTAFFVSIVGRIRALEHEWLGEG